MTEEVLQKLVEQLAPRLAEAAGSGDNVAIFGSLLGFVLAIVLLLLRQSKQNVDTLAAACTQAAETNAKAVGKSIDAVAKATDEVKELRITMAGKPCLAKEPGR